MTPRQGRGGRVWHADRAWPRPAVVLGIVACTFVLAACGGGETPLPGTNLDRSAAPDFRLTDQSGQTLALSDFRGRAVVLTFLYTTCPDFCPATAVKLRQTAELMGKDAQRVMLLAVSVDPIGDDRQAAQEFSTRLGMPEGLWHYCIGTEDELAPVWSAYAIGRVSEPAGGAPRAGAAAADVLGHTEALYVIDTRGRERTLLRGDFKPAELAAALRGLVR